MLRNIRPHSLGIVAAAIARPNDSQTTTQDTSDHVVSHADNDSNRQAQAVSKEESLLTTRINGNPISTESEEKRSSQSQRTTTCEATCAIQDAENGIDSTISKFEVSVLVHSMHATTEHCITIVPAYTFMYISTIEHINYTH